MYLKSFDETLLNCEIMESDNPKGIIVINHGFSEHLGRYGHLARFLVNNGYNVIRYDLRGHGKTTAVLGRLNDYQDFIKDCDVVVDYCKDSYPGLPLIIIGHSMGGFVSVNYALEHQDKINSMILSGPALYDLPKSKGLNALALNVMGRLFPRFSIDNPIGDEICSVKEVVVANRNDKLVLKKVSAGMLYQFLKKGSKNIKMKQNDFDLPVLILHGEADSIVPQQVSQSFFEAIRSKDKTRIVYPNLYHEIFNEHQHDEIFNTILNWLKEREK